MTTHALDGSLLTQSAGRASSARRWAARAITGIPVLFLLFDGVTKLMLVPQVTEATAQLGWAVSLADDLGVLLLVCLAVYLIPRTAVLGAILLTAYLGGAVAAQVRVGNPLLSHVLFPTYVALMLWGGLWLRDARLRALLSPKR